MAICHTRRRAIYKKIVESDRFKGKEEIAKEFAPTLPMLMVQNNFPRWAVDLVFQKPERFKGDRASKLKKAFMVFGDGEQFRGAAQTLADGGEVGWPKKDLNHMRRERDKMFKDAKENLSPEDYAVWLNEIKEKAERLTVEDETATTARSGLSVAK